MRQQRHISQTQLIIEQIALLFASFVWTIVILSILVLVWAIQDIESNWNLILGIQPTAVHEPELALFIEPTPTPRPTSTSLPTPTKTPIPLATSTTAIQPPSILPDTPNQDDPTPVPIIIHADEELPAYFPTVALSPTSKKATALSSPISKTVTTPVAATSAPTSTPPPQASGATPTRLVISSVGIDSEIVSVGWDVVEKNGQQYSLWRVADYAIGWHKTTALPGESGNTVMAGHHNINGEVFKDLVNVEVGDEVVIYTENETYTYKVELKTIVKEKGESLETRQKNAEWIAATTDERITMVTCWPYTNNTHRVIVVAKPS